MSMFTKATKAEAKARIAVTGPAGSGKTYGSLIWAKVLAEGGKIALIDTERESSKMYGADFDFDVASLAPPYHPDRLIEALKEAENCGYEVVIIDSLTHFWSGQGGVLEIVDQAKSRFNGNTHSAWQVGTPIQQRMVDAILAYKGHIITTMRSKTEWAMETNERGKVAPKKVGLAPQQRDGIEYEYTLVLEMNTEHDTIIGKTRCNILADRVFTMRDASEAATIFQTWLKAGDPLLTAEQRGAVDNAIAALTPAGRRVLRDEWAKVGLPKVASLTADRFDEAITLIEGVAANATDEPDEPSDEVVPS